MTITNPQRAEYAEREQGLTPGALRIERRRGLRRERHGSYSGERPQNAY